MSDETYFRVKLPVELTIRAATAGDAKVAAVEAVAAMLSPDRENVRSASVGPGAVEEIEREELRKVTEWLES